MALTHSVMKNKIKEMKNNFIWKVSLWTLYKGKLCKIHTKLELKKKQYCYEINEKNVEMNEIK